jgi:superfamily II DNA or RNA helicase
MWETNMSYAVGSLVKARDREWVVLPDSEDDFIVLRPLGGSEHEITGISTTLESIEPASFSLPNPDHPGDYYSCHLLRNAIKLGFRSSAGPFRSFARIAVDPRPYQLVPLLIALKQHPIRMLIADDVGIGKTIEAGLIVRELLDRGEIQRLAVLCPSQLAEQWQSELSSKFHIDAELVLTSTATRLEKQCRVGQSLFDYYPFVIVSTDFIKSDRRRDDFFRNCPEMVIVDEAHTCAFGGDQKGIRHQRHSLIQGLAQDPERHLVLLTATPHSGKETAFRSLLCFLNKEFENLPDDLSGKANEHHRKTLAKYFIQRKRGDIADYLDSKTIFPQRDDLDASYTLSPEYKSVFDRAINYAKENIWDESENQFRQRVQWWSALAMLRTLASSPAAAAATLRNRAVIADAETIEQVDEFGRRLVLDTIMDESNDSLDISPGCHLETNENNHKRARLLKLARDVEGLKIKKDHKLTQALSMIKDLLKNGYCPIVFCRFVQTAEYVSEILNKKLSNDVSITAVTGLLPPKEREDRILELSQSAKRVLVCTDCLSEGINLQDHFDAVFHYDLSWNPTRHEQREGRVDRYAQVSKTVRVITFYGIDNPIDGIVLNTLLKKHKTIRHSLGISVPLPGDSNQVVEAIIESVLNKKTNEDHQQLSLPGLSDFGKRVKKDALFKEWDKAVEREKKSRTLFAQRTINVNEVMTEMTAIQKAVGSTDDIQTFVKEALSSHGVNIIQNQSLECDLTPPDIDMGLKESIGINEKINVCFELPVKNKVIYLNRTHPMVEGLCSYVMETAFDPIVQSKASRTGVIQTRSVQKRTTLLLLRFRYHIITKTGNTEKALLAEDSKIAGFSGTPSNALWISDDTCEQLIHSKPDANVSLDRAKHFLQQVVDQFDCLKPHLDHMAAENGEIILDAHKRVRKASKLKHVTYRIKGHAPDVLGLYIYLPHLNH